MDVAEGRELVLLDTDIGSDIDDSLCLAYLLHEPRCDLLGITTVTGDTKKRASCCDAVCRAAGRTDVPIHPGATDVLLSGPGQPDVPRFAGLQGRHAFRTDWPEHSAVDFLRHTIHAHPGEITLLGIGPLTNIALLFKEDPEIPGLLKRLVLMCGVFAGEPGHGPGAREWNARVDPAATCIVYRSHVAEHRSIGLDVTKRCSLATPEMLARIEGVLPPVVRDMATVYLEDRVTFHDPLAAVTVFHPAVCTYASGTVSVETTSPHLSGLTTFAPGPPGPHLVAASVESDRFFQRFFGVFH